MCLELIIPLPRDSHIARSRGSFSTTGHDATRAAHMTRAHHAHDVSQPRAHTAYTYTYTYTSTCTHVLHLHVHSRLAFTRALKTYTLTRLHLFTPFYNLLHLVHFYTITLLHCYPSTGNLCSRFFFRRVFFFCLCSYSFWRQSKYF